jgi:hypothetical protein
MSTIIGFDHLHDAASLWDDVLRSYAESLDEQRAYLLTAQPDELIDGGRWMPPMFAPPASMPPMPDEFASWARALLRETEGLARLAADVLERIPAPTPRALRPQPTTGEITTGQSTWDRSM